MIDCQGDKKNKVLKKCLKIIFSEKIRCIRLILCIHVNNINRCINCVVCFFFAPIGLELVAIASYMFHRLIMGIVDFFSAIFLSKWGYFETIFTEKSIEQSSVYHMIFEFD